MKKNYKRTAALCMMLLVMALIFAFSSRAAEDSAGQSKIITGLICRLIFFRYEKMTAAQRSFVVTELDFFIRKLAHFSIYFLLGICSYAVFLLGETNIRKKWTAAMSVCIVYAILDEIHQYFIPGRAMRALDVCIDSLGALTGMIVLRIIIIVFTYAVSYIRRQRISSAKNSGKDMR